MNLVTEVDVLETLRRAMKDRFNGGAGKFPRAGQSTRYLVRFGDQTFGMKNIAREAASQCGGRDYTTGDAPHSSEVYEHFRRLFPDFNRHGVVVEDLGSGEE